MNNKRFTWAAVLLLLLASGCSGYESIYTVQRSATYKGKRWETPQGNWYRMPVFSADKLPEREFNIRAEVSVTAGKSSTRFNLLNRLRRQAGKYNADALFITNERSVSRDYTNGVNLMFELVDAVTVDEDECCCAEDDYDWNTHGSYRAQKITAWAIKYIEYAEYVPFDHLLIRK